MNVRTEIRKRKILMLDLGLEYEYMKEEIDGAIKKCLDHQQWILGPEVRELEEKISSYLGVKHCVGVSSGTEALVVSLRAMALKTRGQEYFDESDEIITTPFTFTATGDAILRAGATPVFIDIDPATYNIDTRKIRKYLESGSGRVRGILPVHLYGGSCGMDEIMSVAKEFGLFVIEDVAQAFGGGWDGKKLGSIGDAGAFSFFPSKNLGGFGDGGMLATNDDETAALSRMLIKHGGQDKYNVDHVGYNARLDTLQAAIILAKFRYIDEMNDRRRAIARSYTNTLSGTEGIKLPIEIPGAHHVYHQYTIGVREQSGYGRDDLQEFMSQRGISTMIYYPVPLHMMKVFQGRCKQPYSLDESRQAAKEVLSLPIEPLMSYADVLLVANCVKEFYIRG